MNRLTGETAKRIPVKVDQLGVRNKEFVPDISQLIFFIQRPGKFWPAVERRFRHGGPPQRIVYGQGCTLTNLFILF
jgi:hypothetical protein